MGTEEMLTVTFQNSSRLGYLIRMNVVRRSSGFRSGRMCLELVKNDRGLRGFWLGDQSGQKISIELESLILAQNERWRQA